MRDVVVPGASDIAAAQALKSSRYWRRTQAAPTVTPVLFWPRSATIRNCCRSGLRIDLRHVALGAEMPPGNSMVQRAAIAIDEVRFAPSRPTWPRPARLFSGGASYPFSFRLIVYLSLGMRHQRRLLLERCDLMFSLCR